MKGWAKKDAMLRVTKSGAVAPWLARYNEWVPGTIVENQGPRVARPGCVLMAFSTPMRSKFVLDLPEEDVTFTHSWFRHSVPYKGLALVRELEKLR